MNIKLNRKRRSVSHNSQNSKSLNRVDLNFSFIAANVAEEKKGENILLLDISRLSVISDYFLIITAKSTPQIEALAKYIEEKLEELNCKLISREGLTGSNWVILDFGNLVVHIMNETERAYYKLERFWSNAIIVDKKKWKKAS